MRLQKFDSGNRSRSKAPGRRGERARAVALLAIVGGLVATIGSTGASAAEPVATTLPGTLLHGGAPNNHITTMFAFVKKGETFAPSFKNAADNNSGITVKVTNPAGKVLAESGPGGAGVSDLRFVAETDGVWSVTLQDPAKISNVPKFGMEWSIAVERNGQTVPGRVFSESIAFNTPEKVDLSVYALTKTGGLYEQTLRGYNGVDSTLRVNNKGNVRVGDAQCRPAYKSVPMAGSIEGGGVGTQYAQPNDPSSCAGLEKYRLFLDKPSADLPAHIAQWADGRTVDTWVGPQYAAPQIVDLTYKRSGTGSNAGTLNGVLATQPGTVNVEIDTDGDGLYDGERDVRLVQIAPQTGAFSVAWDGKDKTGQVVPTNVKANFRATLNRTNEAHFLRVDVETAEGGIEVTRLTGGNTNPKVLYYDDTIFEKTSDERYSRIAPYTSGKAGLDSTGGLHRWKADDAGDREPNPNTGSTGSWGDLRSIDDWTYGADNAVAAVGIDPLAPHVKIEKHGKASASPLVAGSSIDYSVKLTSDGTGDFTDVNPAAATDYLDKGVNDKAVLDKNSIKVTAGTASVDKDGRIQWNAGALPVGAEATLTFKVLVLPNDDKSKAGIVNTACVASAPHKESDSEYGTDVNPCATVPFSPPAPPTVPPTTPAQPAPPVKPSPTAPAAAPKPSGKLASTGADGPMLAGGIAAGVVLLSSGFVAAALARQKRRATSAENVSAE